jgi:pimeloyl-ACP methyl ester carboxylesterase
VIAFDMIGFGTRMDEGHYFYERFPRWSKMGKMVDDVVASIDAIGMLPCLDKNKIFLVGNTIGGNVALLTAALDERVAGVAVTAAFTPWRDESFPHGFETIADSHCFLPQLGCWRGRQKDIPIDYTEILPCIAPRPMLIIAPTLDWHANHDAVKQTVGQAQCIYDLYNRTANLQFETTEEINRLTKDMQKTLMKSLCKWRDRPHAAKVVGQCLEPAGLGTTK